MRAAAFIRSDRSLFHTKYRKMYSVIKTAVLQGLESIPIQVETNISEGMPVFEMVGFLGAEVKEARERVRIGLQNSGIYLPPKRITINFVPANIRKSGSAFDLAVAASILCALGRMEQTVARSSLFIGEVGLNGEVLPVHGILSAAILARKQHICRMFVPWKNRKEARVFSGVDVIPVTDLEHLMEICSSEKMENFIYLEKQELMTNHYEEDFQDIYGQELVKRACEIAVSGMHNLLMIGPPGSGKSMIAKRIPSILPAMEWDEILELSQIYHAANIGEDKETLVTNRPFRAPHHTITPQGMCGGGKNPLPGEISLAHKGVLFLDEFPEFQKNLIDMLRQPMEDKKIRISRVGGSVCFPCDFMLVAAMNPCKCGYYPDLSRCRCTPSSVQSYINHISQPMLDRIDMTVETRELSFHELLGKKKSESSDQIRRRVERTHEIQKKRFQNKGYYFNAHMSVPDVNEFCVTNEEGKKYLEQIVKEQGLSARAYFKILKVARTIADMEEQEQIAISHLMEACAYRSLDKKYWGRME